MGPFSLPSARELSSYIDIDDKSLITIAIQLCQKLQHLHDAELSHQHISPNTVFISPCLSHTILRHIYPAIPFKTSHELSHQGVPGAHDTEFISPEQHHRIAKVIDFRSDIYSLGLVFYFLLTKRTPLSMETGTPYLYYTNNDTICPNIKSILSKMTARFPEDRYQSFTGVLKDLHAQSSDTSPLFFPGITDTPEHFYGARHLFGREKEIETLHKLLGNKTTFPRLLISGEAGVGKTTLIQNVISQLFHLDKSVIYNQASPSKSTPFPTVSKILSSFISTLITEKNASNWSNLIHEKLRSHTLLIADTIPELRTLLFCDDIGPYKASQHEPHKIFYAYAELFKLLASTAQGTMVIIDDAHWISELEFDLLNSVIQNTTTNIGFVISNRPSETSPIIQHQLSSVTNHRIPLTNLSHLTVSEWLDSQFNPLLDKYSPLSWLLYKRTQGNPHKITQTLHFLKRRHHLTFQKGIRKWIFNLNMSDPITQKQHTQSA